MGQTETIAELESRIAAKQAYGVKTTRLENELHRRKQALKPAWRRFIEDLTANALIWAFAVLFWGLQFAWLYRSLATLFKH